MKSAKFLITKAQKICIHAISLPIPFANVVKTWCYGIRNICVLGRCSHITPSFLQEFKDQNGAPYSRLWVTRKSLLSHCRLLNFMLLLIIIKRMLDILHELHFGLFLQKKLEGNIRFTFQIGHLIPFICQLNKPVNTLGKSLTFPIQNCNN